MATIRCTVHSSGSSVNRTSCFSHYWRGSHQHKPGPYSFCCPNVHKYSLGRRDYKFFSHKLTRKVESNVRDQQNTIKLEDGRLFGPLEEGSGWFDDTCLFQPIVLEPMDSKNGEIYPWRMYYYGRNSDTWQDGAAPALITTGSIGMAVSDDGICWKRFHGHLKEKAIFTPRELGTDTHVFDELHVGCGDVIVLEKSSESANQPKEVSESIGEGKEGKEWWLFYFGGSLEKIEVFPGRMVKGFRMRCGIARSEKGTEFAREENFVLDVGKKGDWDELFVGWPRVFDGFSIGKPSELKRNVSTNVTTNPIVESSVDETEGKDDTLDSDNLGFDEKLSGKKWIMTYSAIERTMPPRSSIGIAISRNLIAWKKLGKVLESGPAGSWDEGGVSRRHVLKIDDLFVMFYEGVSRDGFHSIGVATSMDGLVWTKDGNGGESLGGPVFSPRKGESVWDNTVVACPHVIKLSDGSFWMYYLGQDESKKTYAIGLAVSDGPNYRNWFRYKHSTSASC